jgi:hypothetical protein
MAAVMQTVPDIDGTEIILETTAYGFKEFHELWRKAESGESEFVLIFLPWSIDPEYRARLPDNFDMSAEEHRLAELHGLDAEQICWRRNKISQLFSPELFSQEYPLVASEAFISSDFDSLISPDLLVRARREQVEPYGPLLIGVDPAGKGADSTAIAWRQDHCTTKTERRKGLTTMIDQSKAWRTSGSLWVYPPLDAEVDNCDSEDADPDECKLQPAVMASKRTNGIDATQYRLRVNSPMGKRTRCLFSK